MEQIKTEEEKGIIPFPCCPGEKIIVYECMQGRTSNKCPRCGKYAVFDFEKMISYKGMPLRGVNKGKDSNGLYRLS